MGQTGQPWYQRSLFDFFYFYFWFFFWWVFVLSCPTLPVPRHPAWSCDDHMPEAPSPMLAVWLMQGSVWTVLGKSWVRIRPFSPLLPLPLIRVRVEQRMASLMDCYRETKRRSVCWTWSLDIEEDMQKSKPKTESLKSKPLDDKSPYCLVKPFSE